MLTDDQIWFSPISAYSSFLKVRDEVGLEAVLSNRKYQRVMETRAVAVLCFAMYVADHTPWWMQLCKNDPPDAFIMRASPTELGTKDVLGIEVTTYVRNKMGEPDDTLLEQLKKTKMFAQYHKYTDHDVILVDLGNEYGAGYEAVQSYMAEIDAPYEAWFIQEVQSTPNTLLQMTICNKELLATRSIDIGQAWHDMKEANVPGKIRTQRVGSIEKVGTFTSVNRIEGAPWETML